jgi:hypothetical protein
MKFFFLNRQECQGSPRKTRIAPSFLAPLRETFGIVSRKGAKKCKENKDWLAQYPVVLIVSSWFNSCRISLASLAVQSSILSFPVTVQGGVANLAILRIVNRYFFFLAGGGPRDV